MGKSTRLALDLATIVIAGCAIVSTVLVVRAQVAPALTASHPASPPVRAISPSRWLFAGGRRIGPPNAAVTLVEFGDFECPACSAFFRELRPLRAKNPSRLAIVYHYDPLPYHRFALAAARAAECAARQGRFEQMHDLLYELQDSFGLLKFEDMARRAGVPSTTGFRACESDPKVEAVIDSDRQLAIRLRLMGTPSVVFDDSLWSGAPPLTEIQAAVHADRGSAQLRR